MFDSADMFLWMLATFRASGLLLIMPAFAVRTVPAVVRVGLATILGWIAMPMLEGVVIYPSHTFEAVLLISKEIAIGLLMGLAVRLIFITIEFAARILAVEVGINPNPAFDPQQGSGGNPIGSGLYYVAIVVMFSGAQYAFLYAFMRSFELVTPGLQAPSVGFVSMVVLHTARIFQLGLLMAAPIIAVNFLVNLTFALLGRVVPKMNVFILSFSLRILAGLSMLILSTSLLVHYIMQQMTDAPELMLRFIPFVDL